MFIAAHIYCLFLNKADALNIIDLGLFLEKSISKVFGSIKLHKKGSRNIIFVLLKKLSLFRGKFYSTGLVQTEHYLT